MLWLHSKTRRGRCVKLNRTWTGLWRIIKRLREIAYRIKYGGCENVSVRRPVIHHNQLKRFHDIWELETADVYTFLSIYFCEAKLKCILYSWRSEIIAPLNRYVDSALFVNEYVNEYVNECGMDLSIIEVCYLATDLYRTCNDSDDRKLGEAFAASCNATELCNITHTACMIVKLRHFSHRVTWL